MLSLLVNLVIFSQGQHSYGSYFLEYSLMAEYNLLLKQKLPGIYCIPSANSSLLWFGVLFIRQGPYQEGVFRLVTIVTSDMQHVFLVFLNLPLLRFQVMIPDNYPDGDVPKVVFESHVFHPCIDPNTHQLNVKQVWFQCFNGSTESSTTFTCRDSTSGRET